MSIAVLSQGFLSRIVDCEQSLCFFRFSEGSAHARERRAAKPRDAINEGRTSVVIFVSRANVSLDGLRKNGDCS